MTKELKPHHTTYINVPEAVGVFENFKTLQAAIYDLRMSGFSRGDISLLGGKEAMEEKLGSAYWRAADLEDNPDAPRAAFVSEEAIGELEGAVAGGFFFLDSLGCFNKRRILFITIKFYVLYNKMLNIPGNINIRV